MAEANFAARMLLHAVVLILLSVTTLAQNATRCYWCGPLAEQVHRSQRAPACGAVLLETMCDPGYTHCAVVATSPPYAESRLCVKFYQDECYSLYCNTTKTWRMICPCQGSLCNGQNTQREGKAFATLAKNVASNKRNKRCLTAKAFFPVSPRKSTHSENNISTTPDSEATTDTTQIQEQIDDNIDMIQTIIVINEDHKDHESEILNNIIEENEEIQLEKESEIQGDQPLKMDEDTTEDGKIVETLNEHTETTITIGDMNSEPMVENKDDNAVTVQAEFVKELQETTEIPTQTSMIPTTIEIEVSVVHIKNPNDNLPPPEALQQNVTPAKETPPTTMGTIEMITDTNPIEVTTHSIKDVTKTIDLSKGTKKNKNDTTKMDKKNGEEPVQSSLCKLILIMNIIIALVL